MRGIKLAAHQIRAEVSGVNELVDGIPILTVVKIHYTLEIPSGTREVADRALERHVAKCPTAKTLAGAVDVEWTADITEVPAETGDA